MQSIQVSEQGQLTIPSDMTEKLGIEKGMNFNIIKRNGEYILKPTPLDAFKAIQDILEGEAERLGWKSEEDAMEYYNNFLKEKKRKLNANND